jgi:hypothetical protein
LKPFAWNDQGAPGNSSSADPVVQGALEFDWSDVSFLLFHLCYFFAAVSTLFFYSVVVE